MAIGGLLGESLLTYIYVSKYSMVHCIQMENRIT